MRKSHYPWIDWVRFLTAFLVMVCHCRSGHWQPWGDMSEESKHVVSYVFFVVTRPALEFVVVFFVLSGFLVGGPVMKRAWVGTFDWRTYSIDRLSRIYVPLVPCMLITGALASWAGNDLRWNDFFGCLLGLQGSWCGEFAANSPLWSLGYEIWFYVLAGAVASMTSSRGGWSLTPLLFLLLSLIVFVRLDQLFLFCWLLGVVGSVISIHTWPKLYLAAGAIIGGVGMLVAQPTFIHLSLSTNLSLAPSEIARLGCLVLAFGLMFMMPGLAALPAGRMATTEALGSRLAAFSYTLYLSHYPLLHFWGWFDPVRQDVFSWPTFGTFLLKLCACVVFALILYGLFEAHTSTVRGWMKRRLFNQAA